MQRDAQPGVKPFETSAAEENPKNTREGGADPNPDPRRAPTATENAAVRDGAGPPQAPAVESAQGAQAASGESPGFQKQPPGGQPQAAGDVEGSEDPSDPGPRTPPDPRFAGPGA